MECLRPVLRPLLFTVYINDINNSISSTRLFADDACLILQDKSLCQFNKKIITEIESLNKWMMANKLTLNLSKSKMIIIQSKNLNNKVKFSTITGPTFLSQGPL